MSDVLIVGASRGLGASLVRKYAAGTKGTVFPTHRSKPTSEPIENVKDISGIDLTLKDAGSELTSALEKLGAKLGTVIITAGYFSTETFDEPKWEDEVKMQVSLNDGLRQKLQLFIFNSYFFPSCFPRVNLMIG